VVTGSRAGLRPAQLNIVLFNLNRETQNKRVKFYVGFHVLSADVAQLMFFWVLQRVELEVISAFWPDILPPSSG
jgi:hypothetical protein